jgi:hypothetical protein
MTPVVDDLDGGELARAYLANYARVPEYARSLRRQGLAAEIDAITAGWSAGKQHAAAAVSPAMLHSLVLPTDRESRLPLMEAYQAAGVTTVLLLPIVPTSDDNDPFASAQIILRAFARPA